MQTRLGNSLDTSLPIAGWVHSPGEPPNTQCGSPLLLLHRPLPKCSQHHHWSPCHQAVCSLKAGTGSSPPEPHDARTGGTQQLAVREEVSQLDRCFWGQLRAASADPRCGLGMPPPCSAAPCGSLAHTTGPFPPRQNYLETHWSHCTDNISSRARTVFYLFILCTHTILRHPRTLRRNG